MQEIKSSVEIYVLLMLSSDIHCKSLLYLHVALNLNIFCNSGGSTNFEKRGGGTPQSSENLKYIGSEILSFTNI
jgi:hypothetical protein